MAKCIVVACRSNDDTVLINRLESGGFIDGCFQCGNILLQLGRNIDNLRIHLWTPGCCRHRVHLVEDGYQLFLFCQMPHLHSLFCRRLPVNNPQDNRCLIQFLISTSDSQLFNLVVGVTDASRIDESKSNTLNFRCVFNGITCSPMDIGHNGFLFVQETVEECRLSYIRLADDGDRDTSFQCVTGFKGFCQGYNPIVDFLSQYLQFRTVSKLKFLMIGEIQFQLQQRSHFQELFPKL